ncbi:MAG TPA: helix-turn-helix domain-containing protein [Candidatus Limnocylindrales bacterium]|nr:helix-turn-helix domain-containing protein [Candidatus Limnocylindrales bacterium]
MSSQIRQYRLKVRAERQAATRQRIVEATAALHEEVGPARTTVAEIARRAGVQRLTVYNNFPNETELFDACGQHWTNLNPTPDPSAALAIVDPDERVRAVLGPLFRWYRKHAQAIEHLQRDRLVMPAFDAVMRIRMDQQFAHLADALSSGFAPNGRRAKRVRAVVALALDFWTWRRLANEGMSDQDAASVMVGAVKASAQDPPLTAQR